MTIQWVYHTDDPLPADIGEPRELLGGKGASLHEMTSAGLPVPPAFVITTEACEYFFAHDETWPPGLEDQVRGNLERLERDMGRVFGKGAQPLLVSVRSGAARSMPGMMDTLLNVGLHPGLADDVEDTAQFWDLYAQFVVMYAKTVADMPPGAFDQVHGKREEVTGRETVTAMIEHFQKTSGQSFPTTPWELLTACIAHVFRSWNNDRALRYRQRHDIRGLRGTAVNVQVMFPSRVSGIVFTRDPTDLSEHLVIEASYGLGEAVVSGDVTPDRFVVDRETLSLKQANMGNKPHAVGALGDRDPFDPHAFCLEPAQLRELCMLSLRVEEHFGKPMDIEFGLAGGRFGLLQCRAIRGLDVLADVEVGRREEIDRLKALAKDKAKVWVTHNLGETLRAPTPLTWDIMRHFMSGSGGFGRMYEDFGYLPSEDVKRDGFLELICGRIYADPDRLAKLFWAGMPMRYDLEKVVNDPSTMDSAPAQFEADEVEPEFLLQAPRIVGSMIKTSRAMKEARRNAHDRFENEALPPFLEYVEEKRAQDLTTLPTRDVIAELHGRRRRVLDEFGPESLKPGFIGGMALARLTRMIHQFAEGDEGDQVVNMMTTALEGDVTFEQDKLLYDVARGNATMDEFLERFGHRSLGEMELMNPRYREDTGYLERVVDQLAQGDRDPETMHRENVERRDAVIRELPDTLTRWGAGSFTEDVQALVEEVRRLLPYRERGKYYLMMGYELIRLAILELSRRWDVGNDVFFLQLSELEAFDADPDAFEQTIAGRRVRWQSAQKLDLPDVIQSSQLERIGLPPETVTDSPGHWQGDAIASGTATGTARLVFDPAQAGDLGSGYILVCPSTDPGWTPLFINAAGLVVEKGGVLSHGAIVARDFGIPAVVCPNATKLIEDGADIRVDGNTGTVGLA